MSDTLFTGIFSIGMAIVGVAIIATLVSPKAQTANVIGSAGQAFATALGAATGPVTGMGMGASVGRSFY